MDTDTFDGLVKRLVQRRGVLHVLGATGFAAFAALLGGATEEARRTVPPAGPDLRQERWELLPGPEVLPRQRRQALPRRADGPGVLWQLHHGLRHQRRGGPNLPGGTMHVPRRPAALRESLLLCGVRLR